VAIAAGVFVSAGVILLYIVNLNFAQRVVRSLHPRFGRSKLVVVAFAAYYVSVVCVLIMGESRPSPSDRCYIQG